MRFDTGTQNDGCSFVTKLIYKSKRSKLTITLCTHWVIRRFIRFFLVWSRKDTGNKEWSFKLVKRKQTKRYSYQSFTKSRKLNFWWKKSQQEMVFNWYNFSIGLINVPIYKSIYIKISCLSVCLSVRWRHVSVSTDVMKLVVVIFLWRWRH